MQGVFSATAVTHVSFCGGGILSADRQFVNYMSPVS